MANVDTLPEILRPLMEGPSIETPRCAVCGAPWPLNRHHIVRRGAGRLNLCSALTQRKCSRLACASPWQPLPLPLPHSITVGLGTSRPSRNSLPAPPGSGHWEYLLLPEPTKYADALAMDGWGRLPRGRRCM